MTHSTTLAQLLLTLLLFLTQNVFGVTTVDLVQAEVITGKSASIESLPEKVAVFITEADPGSSQSLSIHVNTDAKFHIVTAQVVNGSRVQVSKKQNGDHYFLGSPGKYEIMVITFDPETGPGINYFEGEIKPSSGTDPPPPPPGDFDTLRKVAKEKAIALNDPPTARALSIAYKNATQQMAGKTYAESKDIAIAARRAVLVARKGQSLFVDWNSFLFAVDVELSKVVRTQQDYQIAIQILSEVLQ